MKIDIDVLVNGKMKKIGVEPGVTVQDIARFFEDSEPYPFLIATLNNQYVDLTEKIHTESTVELLDGRYNAAYIAYQKSLLLVYFYAVKKVLGKETRLRAENSLSGGIFTYLYDGTEVTKELVEKIEKEMMHVTAMNLPIMQTEVDGVRYCSIDGYTEHIPSCLVASTGYLEKFQLVPYKEGIIVRGISRQDPLKIKRFEEEPVIYEAFEKEMKWADILEIKQVEQLNKYITGGIIKEKILLAEAFAQQGTIDIAKEIIEKEKKAVFIAGPSSSGKTTFAKRIVLQLQVNGLKPVYLGIDDYFVERHQMAVDSNGEYDFDRGIENVDIALFKSNIRDLLDGKEVSLPTYDFALGKKMFGDRILSLHEGELLVIEGIYALHEEMSDFISKDDKYKIYISPLTQLNVDDFNTISNRDSRLVRRMIRDYYHRAYDAANTIKAWPNVMKGEEKNIFPTSKEADVVFNTVLIYELAVLKKYAEPILKEVSPDQPEYAEAKRLLEFLSLFESIEDDSPISNTSIIREFIGGSAF